MAFKLEDGVWETTNTTGPTAAYALLGEVADPAAVAAFGDVFAHGDQFLYRCWLEGEGYEEGVGEYDSALNKVIRVRIIKSSAGGAAKDWAGGGTKNIAVIAGSGALTSLLDPSTGLGFRVRRANETFAHRTLTLGAGLSGANLDGVAGNPSIAVVADTYAPYAIPTLSGGTAGRVVRISAADTCVDAAKTDTVAQLSALLWKTAGGLYLPPGRLVTGLTGKTAGAVQYLDTSGNITQTEPNLAANPTWCKVVVGFALSTTRIWFEPRVPIRGS